MLELTKPALAAIHQVMADADFADGGLRIAVLSKGCAGLGYQLALEEKPSPGDEIITLAGVTVFVDPVSRPLLEGVVVDFVEAEAGAGFVFDNPNAKGGCACGKSPC